MLFVPVIIKDETDADKKSMAQPLRGKETEMMNIVKNNQLDGVFAAENAVVDLNASWCGPCRMLGPVLEELSDEMIDQAAFFSVDVDQNPDVASKYNVSAVPTVLFLKKGELVDSFVGFQPKPAVSSWIQKNL